MGFGSSKCLSAEAIIRASGDLFISGDFVTVGKCHGVRGHCVFHPFWRRLWPVKDIAMSYSSTHSLHTSVQDGWVAEIIPAIHFPLCLSEEQARVMPFWLLQTVSTWAFCIVEFFTGVSFPVEGQSKSPMHSKLPNSGVAQKSCTKCLSPCFDAEIIGWCSSAVTMQEVRLDDHIGLFKH